MINHGITRARTAPENIVIDEFSVWKSEDVREVTVTDEEGTHTEYEFKLIQYGKDEYIHLMVDDNASMNEQLTDAQMALCDLYEMIGG